MKILQIGKFYPIRGGVEKVMYDITVGLSQRQVHCDMLCASAEQQRPKSLSLNKYARILCGTSTVLPTHVEKSGGYYAGSGHDLPLA